MKALKLIAVVLILTLVGSVAGQVSIRVKVGTPPAWGPSGHANVRYYYLPDVEAYYDVQTSMFIYISGNRWVHRTYLPTRYRNYDLYRGYKVVMNDYRGNSPYTHFKEHKMKYAKGYRGIEQRNIGERNNFKGKQPNDGQSHRMGNQGNGRNQIGNKNQNQDNKGGKHGNDKNSKKDNGNGNGNRK